MQLVIETVKVKRGIDVNKSIAINAGRAQNAIPAANSTTKIFYQEDRRKAGTPLPWLVDGAYASVVANYVNYIPGLSIVLFIETFDRVVVNRNQLLAIDNISYIMEKPGDPTKSVVLYEYIGKFELIEIEVGLPLGDLVSLINNGYY
jgi:hypothetical protein